MNQTPEEIILFLKGANGADALGRLTPKGIVILQNSRISTRVHASLPAHLKDIRDRLLREEILAHKDDLIIFDLEYQFSDPSTAAAVVLGREADGLTLWKTRDGKSLGQIVSS